MHLHGADKLPFIRKIPRCTGHSHKQNVRPNKRFEHVLQSLHMSSRLAYSGQVHDAKRQPAFRKLMLHRRLRRRNHPGLADEAPGHRVHQAGLAAAGPSRKNNRGHLVATVELRLRLKNDVGNLLCVHAFSPRPERLLAAMFRAEACASAFFLFFSMRC